MIYNDSQYHNELIIDQFTKQAIPFTQNGAQSAEYAVKRLLTLGNVTKEDINKIRQLYIEDVQNNILGVNSHYVGTEIHFTFPTSMIIAQKS
jgi:hypothetical protein